MTIDKVRRILREYQSKGASLIKNNDSTALFWEMRIGKTLTTIRSFKNTASMYPVLISAPYSPLNSWYDELISEGFNNDDILFLKGTGEEKYQQFKKDKPVYLVNKESFRQVHLHKKKLGTIVLDESTFIKGVNSDISEYYVKKFIDVPKKIILTGTPAPENEIDYYMQIKFLDNNAFPFNNWYEFRTNWFIEGHKHWFSLSENGKKELGNILAKYCSFLTRKDLGIPDSRIYQKRYIPLEGRFLDIYNKAEKAFILENMKGGIIDVTDYDIVKYSWLRKICNGILDGELKNNQKINELISLIKNELNNKSIVVWCSFNDDIKFISNRLSKEKITFGIVNGSVPMHKRKIVADAFKRGTIQIFLANPESWQYGTDLSTSDVMIYYSSPVKGVTRRQADSRCDNIMINNNTLIIDLIRENSCEEDIYKAHSKKENREATMRTLTQGIIQRQVKVK